MITCLALGTLMLSAFFVRLENFKGGKLHSIDEFVYYRMAVQMKANFFDYNTIPYGQEMAASGRPLPSYFFEPLFKHPPLFTVLTSQSLKVFGNKLISAEYVSLMMSLLTIPLMFLLGSLIYNRTMGMLAAILFYMDPINIITSQKVWMDTTITFFLLLAFFLFVYAIKKNKDNFFVYSGIATGMALNTKYTAVLWIFTIFLFTLMNDRKLFLNKKFLLGLLMPFFLLLPWFVWSYKVYGLRAITMQLGLHIHYLKLNHLSIQDVSVCGGLGLAVLTASVYLFLKLERASLLRNKNKPQQVIEAKNSRVRYLSWGVVTFIFVVFLRGSVFNSLNMHHLPPSSWVTGYFHNASSLFYFYRLIEYSLIYSLAIAYIFLFHPKENPYLRLMKINVFVFLLFFILWKGYQSRYILPIMPMIILLSLDMLKGIYLKIISFEVKILRWGLLLVFFLMVGFSLTKTNHINILHSFPNDMCYY